MPRPSRRFPRPVGALAAFLAAIGLAIGPLALAGPALAAGGPVMDAHPMLGGHGRVGAWTAVAVDLQNDGPPVNGELRVSGGSSGRTRFGVAVDLPTGSRQRHIVYTQPPAFGPIEVTLEADGRSIASKKIPITLHDPTQLLVGVVAEHPERILEGFQVAANEGAQPPATTTLAPEDLPDRVEAWAPLDRLIWQDVDAKRLSPEQITAIRGWLAGGGRLVIVGGTNGPAALAGFPDAILPYRPTATIDAPAESLRSLLGSVPVGAATVPALGGSAGAGRVLATVGSQVIAAERPYGNGAVALVGIDPTSSWMGPDKAASRLWRSLVPGRASSGGLAGSDDSQLVNAVASLPSLALPPIGGLLLLLLGYIVLIGPVNYLVLRRLDRRDWAWLTMPLLIGIFAVGAYAFGAALRGSDLLVNEVAIVRGASGTEEGLGSVYIGIFSPGRGTYQVRVPGGALLSAPISTELIGGPDAGGGQLDLLQGDPSRVRDLEVGFGSLRTIQAATPMAVPRLESDLKLENGSLVGTVTNTSALPLEGVAVVLGGSAAVIGDLGPGEQKQIALNVDAGDANFGMSLSDRIFGQAMFDGGIGGPQAQTAQVRRSVVDQLTFDPNYGPTGQLDAGGPVLLGWQAGDPLPIEIEGQKPRFSGQSLFYVPLGMSVHGPTVFGSSLLRSTVIASDAGFVNKTPFDMSFGQGSVTLAYRPIAFDGTLTPTRLVLAMNTGGPGALPVGVPVAPMAPGPTPSATPAGGNFDGAPDIELFDRTTSAFVRLPHVSGQAVSVDHPERYVDPTTGTVLVRLINDRADGVGFQFFVQIAGDVK